MKKLLMVMAAAGIMIATAAAPAKAVGFELWTWNWTSINSGGTTIAVTPVIVYTIVGFGSLTACQTVATQLGGVFPVPGGGQLNVYALCLQIN